MPRLDKFVDKAGDYNFSNNPRASRYPIVSTMTCHSLTKSTCGTRNEAA